MESLNVVINDELCPKSHSQDTPPIQEKTMEVEDSLPEEYVGKHSDEELQLLNDVVLEPSTPVRETQQEQSEELDSLCKVEDLPISPSMDSKEDL